MGPTMNQGRKEPGNSVIEKIKSVFFKKNKTPETSDSKKPADDVLRESKLRLPSLVKNLPGIIYCCRYDKNFTMIYLSEKFKQITGYDPEDFIQNKKMAYIDIIKPEFQAVIFREWEKAVQEKTRFEYEYQIITASNEMKWIWERGTGIYNSKGKVLFLEGYIEDITRRKQAEDKLKSSDRIFEHSIDMMSVAGFDGYFKVLNPAWERTLGWSIEELLSKPWNHFVHPDDIERTNRVAAEIIDGKEIYRFENRYRCKTGAYKWLSWNSFPYPGENTMFAVARDVTKNKEAEDELRRLKDNLQHEVNEKTRELKQRVAELERFQQATIEREFRMKELRDEIEMLKNSNLYR